MIASEDEKFCTHHGFDWVASTDRLSRLGAPAATPKGASTITMQMAKNSVALAGAQRLRKGFEAYLTVLIEALWSKQRIMEIYLNVIEWGDGVYGAEAAARIVFRQSGGIGADDTEAALLAAVLPNPRHWSPEHPTQYIAERAVTIREDMPAMAVPSANGCR